MVSLIDPPHKLGNSVTQAPPLIASQEKTCARFSLGEAAKIATQPL